MSSDLGNMLRMVGLLGDDEFVDTLTEVDDVVRDVKGTLERVERVERDADQAVREANQALEDVDRRLERFDEMISRLEAKIEAGFSIGFFFFAFNRWSVGDPYLAAGLFLMGLLGASSLVVTVLKMPQIRKLRKMGRLASTHIDVRGSEGAPEDGEVSAGDEASSVDEASGADRDRSNSRS